MNRYVLIGCLSDANSGAHFIPLVINGNVRKALIDELWVVPAMGPSLVWSRMSRILRIKTGERVIDPLSHSMASLVAPHVNACCAAV